MFLERQKVGTKRMSATKEDEEDEEVTPNKSRKTIAEKKLELLSKCTEANPSQEKEPSTPKLSPFAVYVDGNYRSELIGATGE